MGANYCQIGSQIDWREENLASEVYEHTSDPTQANAPRISNYQLTHAFRTATLLTIYKPAITQQVGVLLFFRADTADAVKIDDALRFPFGKIAQRRVMKDHKRRQIVFARHFGEPGFQTDQSFQCAR